MDNVEKLVKEKLCAHEIDVFSEGIQHLSGKIISIRTDIRIFEIIRIQHEELKTAPVHFQKAIDKVNRIAGEMIDG